MQLPQRTKDFDTIYVCRDCSFIHNSAYDIDKCPHCKCDDWVYYVRSEPDEDVE